MARCRKDFASFPWPAATSSDSKGEISIPMANSDNPLDQINHIVVLMLENRSFDNVLGWLYDADNQPPFDQVPRGQSFAGLSGAQYCNPRPGGGEACAGKGTVMTDPFPDPNEPYDHVFTQMFNKVYPKDKIPNT